MIYVIARGHLEGEGDVFWITTDVRSPHGAKWIPVSDLADKASRTSVQTVWLDRKNHIVAEGARVHASGDELFAVPSGIREDRLGALPTYEEYLAAWDADERLRHHTLEAWRPVTVPKHRTA